MQINWVNVLITPLFGAAVGFAVWYFQSRIDTLRRAQERLHDERRKIYSDVLEPFIRVFAGLREPKEMQKAMRQLVSFEYRRTAFEFSLMGSDEVVRAFNDMMQYIYKFDGEGEAKPDPKQMMRLWGAFLLQIRKSVADPKTALTDVEMLRGIIKDVDAFLA